MLYFYAISVLELPVPIGGPSAGIIAEAEVVVRVGVLQIIYMRKSLVRQQDLGNDNLPRNFLIK